MLTMTDVAREAGVSRSTVSFVLNKRYEGVYISEETRQRVLSAASALGYRRNELARAVVTGKNRVLGFLACSPEAELVARMLAGALDEAEAQGYSIKVLRLQNNVVDHATIERCAELRLAVVIALYLNENRLEYLHQEMARYGIPVATLDDSLPHPWGVRVISDDKQGCRLAIQHLVELGHRRIALISGRADAGSAILREQGFREVMEEFGLPVPDGYIQHGNWACERTEVAARALLEHPAGRPTAVLCAGDLMAMVLMRVARRQGINVPEDLSVVGFDDIAAAEAADPPLTTVAQPFQEMGRLAVRRLIETVERWNSATERGILSDVNKITPQQSGKIEMDSTLAPRKELVVEEVLPTRLIVRDSTAKAV
jgi:LacI family transcriptional regulator